MKTKQLTDNEKIYRGCVVGMIENIYDSLYSLAWDLESCPGIATEEEQDMITDTATTLRAISDRLIGELKPYGLEDNR